MLEKSPDIESGRAPTGISHWDLLTNQGILTPEIIGWKYKGKGTRSEPFIVEWITDDPRNPFEWSLVKKWSFAFTMAVATLSVSFSSSAYSGGILQTFIAK